MKPREYVEPMDIPTLCESCGRWQELTEMTSSEKWYPGTVICEECSNLEEQEMQLDDELEECNNQIDDAEYTLKEQKEEKIKILKKQQELEDKIEQYRHGE